jgi:hypothetical protein
MGNIIKKIKSCDKIDIDNTYVCLKNNCNLDEVLYDDFRITDIETDETLYFIQIRMNKNKNSYTVFERTNNFLTPFFDSYPIKEVIKWLS